MADGDKSALGVWRATGRYPGAEKTAKGPWCSTREEAESDARELRLDRQGVPVPPSEPAPMRAAAPDLLGTLSRAQAAATATRGVAA